MRCSGALNVELLDKLSAYMASENRVAISSTDIIATTYIFLYACW